MPDALVEIATWWVVLFVIVGVIVAGVTIVPLVALYRGADMAVRDAWSLGREDKS